MSLAALVHDLPQTLTFLPHHTLIPALMALCLLLVIFVPTQIITLASVISRIWHGTLNDNLRWSSTLCILLFCYARMIHFKKTAKHSAGSPDFSPLTPLEIPGNMMLIYVQRTFLIATKLWSINHSLVQHHQMILSSGVNGCYLFVHAILGKDEASFHVDHFKGKVNGAFGALRGCVGGALCTEGCAVDHSYLHATLKVGLAG